MKIELKECKPFGDYGGHIVLSGKDIGKKFLVLPQSSKYILKEILSQFEEVIEEIKDPYIKDQLTEQEVNEIKKIYKEAIEEADRIQLKKYYEKLYKEIDSLRVSSIGKILDQIENSLPKQLRKKLGLIYYKAKN